jgi:uncharacterized membrane protein YkgB
MTSNVSNRIPSGPAAAAFLSGSLGIFVIGLLTTLSEASHAIGNALNWYNPSGPLVGKTLTGIIVWLISWYILNRMWQDRDVNLKSMFTAAIVIVALGFLLTFPPFFTLFKG